MSYDISLCDPVTRETLTINRPYYIHWNYAPIFYRVMGDEGIRTIYGMTGAESIPVLQDAISQLKADVSNDYWEATDGNAKLALCVLLAFAAMRPDGVWDGD